MQESAPLHSWLSGICLPSACSLSWFKIIRTGKMHLQRVLHILRLSVELFLLTLTYPCKVQGVGRVIKSFPSHLEKQKHEKLRTPYTIPDTVVKKLAHVFT